MRGQISIRHASAITLIAIVTLAACVPPPTGPGPTTTAVPTPTTTVAVVTTTTTPPHFPVIGAFAAAKPAGASPLTTALTWSISDPDGGSLTCGLDVDNNGSYETTVIGCTSASSRTSTFTGAGPHVVGLSVSDGMNTTTTTTTVTVGAASADAFAITVRINGSMTTNQQNAFTNAANRWAALVKGGLADVNLNIGADNCLAGMAAFSGTIDDLLIDAQIATIDGAGGILGQAGPCYTRSSGGLPVYGVMQFDSADVGGLEATGRLEATILHEMGHVLGIGTIWTSPLFTGGGTSNPIFSGTAAVGAWSALGGSGAVPVENTGGPGTADGHWREATFDHELMTGWLDTGSTPLSALTVSALGDLGYSVDLAGADPYGLPGLRASAHSDHEASDLATSERLIKPIGTR